MTYSNLVRIINWLIKIANRIKLHACIESRMCICDFCKVENCKYKHSIDKLIDPDKQ